MTEDPFVTIARALQEHGRPEAPRRVSCFVALGDSFTAGTGSPQGLGWADRIARSLRASHPGFVYRNLAVDGATSADVLGQLGEGLQLEPDLVTVICGANDVLRSTRPDGSLYGRRLTTIFQRIQDAGPRVIVVTATSPERWDFVPLGPRTRARVEAGMRRFNDVTRRVVEAHRVRAWTSPIIPACATATTSPATGCTHRSAAMPGPRRRSRGCFATAIGFQSATWRETQHERQRAFGWRARRAAAGCGVHHPRQDDHRRRPDVLLGPDRRLAPPALGRRMGCSEPVLRPRRARDAGALLRDRPRAVRPGACGRATRPRVGEVQAAGGDRRHDPRPLPSGIHAPARRRDRARPARVPSREPKRSRGC